MSATDAADAGVDLVEDERLARSVGRGQRLQREHDPRELAAGGDARQGPEVFARVRRDVELPLVDPAFASSRLPHPARRSAPRSASGPSPDRPATSRAAARTRQRPPGAPSRASPRDSDSPGGRPSAPPRSPRLARSAPRGRASSCRSAAAVSITSASAGPCFFFRRSRTARRSSTSCSLAGRSVDVPRRKSAGNTRGLRAAT